MAKYHHNLGRWRLREQSCSDVAALKSFNTPIIGSECRVRDLIDRQTCGKNLRHLLLHLLHRDNPGLLRNAIGLGYKLIIQKRAI